MTEKGMPDWLTYMSGDCGWGAERCAELAAESSWWMYLLTHWPAETGFVLMMLFVAWTLPADGWLLIAEAYRRGQSPRPARRRRA